MSTLPHELAQVPRTAWDLWGAFWRARPRLDDAIWAALNGLFISGMSVRTALLDGLGAGSIALLAAAALLGTAAVASRHRWPLLALAGSIAAMALGTLGGMSGPGGVTVMIALATVVSRSAWRYVAWAVPLAVVASALESMFATSLDINPLTTFVAGAAPPLMVVLVTLALRMRWERLQHQDAELRAAAERAADAVRADEQHRGLRERMGIATDLHDAVGHHLTAIVALANGALRSLPADPEGARAAVELIATTARESLGETRSVVDRLGGGAEPIGDARSIDELVATLHAAGVPVRLTRRGAVEASDTARVADTVHAAATADAADDELVFVVVREALTNAVRHAPGASRIDVTVGSDGFGTTVEVRNDRGPAADHADAAVDAAADAIADAPSASPGRGLAGLHRRVFEAGGELDAGPDPSGDWVVRARIPARMRSGAPTAATNETNEPQS